MNEQERREMIEAAMAMIEEAQGLVDEAVRGTSQRAHYEAYGRYGFDRLLGNGNPYDSGLPSLIEALQND